MEHSEIIAGTIILEEDCWIGAGAIIFPRITIGAYSIIDVEDVSTKKFQWI